MHDLCNFTLRLLAKYSPLILPCTSRSTYPTASESAGITGETGTTTKGRHGGGASWSLCSGSRLINRYGRKRGSAADMNIGGRSSDAVPRIFRRLRERLVSMHNSLGPQYCSQPVLHLSAEQTIERNSFACLPDCELHNLLILVSMDSLGIQNKPVRIDGYQLLIHPALKHHNICSADL